jgi:hypothetical protein
MLFPFYFVIQRALFKDFFDQTSDCENKRIFTFQSFGFLLNLASAGKDFSPLKFTVTALTIDTSFSAKSFVYSVFGSLPSVG